MSKPGFAGKRRTHRNPQEDRELVEKKQEITEWLETHHHEIARGELEVFFEDECHLLWGDLCGYVWAAAFGGKLPPESCLGKTDERIEVPIVNQRSKQTYYGAVNVYTHQCLIQAAQAGNSEGTIAFLNYLLHQYPQSRIALIWDGATYHRSQEVREYLESVNQGLDESNWKITCIRFAPNAPRQNLPHGCLVASKAVYPRVLPSVQIVWCG